MDAAYDNRPLPIGHGQTISQPFVVALMTELLDLQPDDSVLEVGTGSGYQAAVLAELAGKVCSDRGDPGTGQQRRHRLGERRLPQRRAAHRQWRARLAGAGAVRCDHRDGRGAGYPTGADRADFVQAAGW